MERITVQKAVSAAASGCVPVTGLPGDLCCVREKDVEQAVYGPLLDCLQKRTGALCGPLPPVPDGWVLRQCYAACLPALLAIWQWMQQTPCAVVAIDGRCGSGKTTLAQIVQEALGGRVLHMDDYYLPMDQRPANWMDIPGGNIHKERFLTQVLRPAVAGQEIQAVAYSCRLGACQPPVVLPAAPLTLIEGSYSQHPDFAPLYTGRIFLTCTPAVQKARLEQREGLRWENFRTRWIPLEEAYYAKCAVPQQADLVLHTDGAGWEP